MLAALSIRNIVLIDELDLTFRSGLTVLTGETGAGKSILLDALGLALGGRGQAGLVRAGEKRGVVTAVFAPADGHAVFSFLDEHGIAAEGEVVLRRQQGADGSSRAFINDQPCSVALLRQVGALLVEIHGQHDERALVDAANHRRLVDAFGGLEDEAAGVAAAFAEWSRARDGLAEHERLIAEAAAEREYLTFAVDELEKLAPVAGEEEELARRRQMMMQAEQFTTLLAGARDALTASEALQTTLNTTLRQLEKRREAAAGAVDEAVEALARLVAEIGESERALDSALAGFEFDPGELERSEERLFALKAAGRKHKVESDRLGEVLVQLKERLAAIEDGESTRERLAAAATAAGDRWRKLAHDLSVARRESAARLERAIMAELAPLKLDKAVFRTCVDTDEEAGGAHGIDRVTFTVATNPGSKPGPLAKIASGGELSRIMLAVKVVLAARGSAPTLVFDEIDTGVGGAAADAVGRRLGRLAGELQVLAVTHSPQVAARADHHLLIAKSAPPAGAVTRVSELDGGERREEIARMLSGADVTEEARAQAGRLLEAVE